MRVRIDCLDSSKGIVFCKLSCAGEVLEECAPFDYVIGHCYVEGYTIENAQEVLWWIHRNCDLRTM